MSAPARPDRPPGAPTVRRATPADRDAVERLLAEAGLPTDGVAELLARAPGDFVVAEAAAGGGAPALAGVAGVAGLEVCRDNALLRSVAVRPGWRGHGVARALVQRLVDDADARGLPLYLLTTTAEDYFPRFGFAPVERAHVPADVAATREFSGACPASAVAMARPLHSARRASR
jgi:amino-acid N-acetyltransferase